MVRIKAAQILQNQATTQLEDLLATQGSQLNKSSKIEKKEYIGNLLCEKEKIK